MPWQANTLRAVDQYSSVDYPTDSSLISAFKKINRLDLLIRVCDGGKMVVTPLVAKQVFPEALSCSGFHSSFTYANSFSDKWIKEPKHFLQDSGILTYSGMISSNNLYTITSGNSYYDCFHLANINYTGLQSSTLSNVSQNYDWINKIKDKADREIVFWAVRNMAEANTILLSNDSQEVSVFRFYGGTALRPIGILQKAEQKGLISYQEAEAIYYSWSIIDPGSCIWERKGGGKKLKDFEEIFFQINKIKINSNFIGT